VTRSYCAACRRTLRTTSGQPQPAAFNHPYDVRLRVEAANVLRPQQDVLAAAEEERLLTRGIGGRPDENYRHRS
jgi:hypothetical protein